MIDLYTADGWLNFDYIFDRGAWLNIIIGQRQIGKTYNVLRGMLDYELTHILLRRTTEEVNTIAASPELCPYKVFEPDYHVSLFRSGSQICRISDYTVDGKGNTEELTQRGLLTSLAQIAHIRGFNGSVFSDLVFDEFIPEKGVVCKKSEGDSFLNAYTTINGNRELSGKPPLRAWLLANTNNINSPILESLNVTDEILYMRRKGKEELLTDKGVLIVQPKSREITDKRKQTALMRQVDPNSDFYGMAIENEFSYDKSPYVKVMPLDGMTPVFALSNYFYCYETTTYGFYICRAKCKPVSRFRYQDTRTDRERLFKDFRYLVPYYYAGLINFADLRLLTTFRNIFDV